MRSHDISHPIAADVRKRVLSFWPRVFADAQVLEQHAGFSGAIIVRLNAGGQNFALRGWPPDAMPPARLVGIHHFQQFLFQRGFTQISVPIPTSEGPTLRSCEGRFWQVEPWMPGEANFVDSPTDAKLNSIMQLLARLHLVAAEYRTEGSSAQWLAVSPAAPSPSIIERSLLLERWCDTNPETVRRLIHGRAISSQVKETLLEILSLFLKHASSVQTELHSHLGLSCNLQPCLRDLWHDHVLYVEESVTGVIDFGGCRSENPMIDLSRLLGSFLIDHSSRWQQALDWYSAQRPLTPTEHRLLSAFDQSQRLLAGMTWIQRLILEQEPQVHWDRVTERLELIVKGFRTLDRI